MQFYYSIWDVLYLVTTLSIILGFALYQIFKGE